MKLATFMLIGHFWHPLIIVLPLGTVPCDEETPRSWLLPREENKRLDHMSNDLTFRGASWGLASVSPVSECWWDVAFPMQNNQNKKELGTMLLLQRAYGIAYREPYNSVASSSREKEKNEMYITNALAFGGTAKGSDFWPDEPEC